MMRRAAPSGAVEWARDSSPTPPKALAARKQTTTLTGNMKLAFPLLVSLIGSCTLGCESSGSEEHQPPPAAHIHPPIPAHQVVDPHEGQAQPSMASGMSDGARRADEAPSATPPAPPPNWNARCLAKRGCARKVGTIAECDPAKKVAEWSELAPDADKWLGKVIEVSGVLGLTGSNVATKPCEPGECCHHLRFDMALDSAPYSVFLPGLTCVGDDSKLCCSVPAESQTVIARGTLQRATGAGILKYQLGSVSLCTPAVAPGH